MQMDVDGKASKAGLLARPDRRHGKAHRRAPRLKMIAAVLFSYLLTATLMAAYALAGGGAPVIALYYLLAGAAVSAFFSVLFASGLGDGFKDHYLTAAQLYATAGVMLSFLYFAPAFSYFLLNALFIAISFGAMRLARRQAITAMAVIGSVLFVVCFVQWQALIPAPTRRLQTLMLYLSFITTLARVMMIGFYNSALRMKLERKNAELAASSEQIKRIASRDELTGIYNRRQLRLTIEERIRAIEAATADQGSTRPAMPAIGGMCIVMLDIDHFKQVNDEYGHPAGDAVIKTFAAIASSVLRATDVIGRYGGEEFIVILEHRDIDSTRTIAERVRASIGSHDWSAIAQGLQVTASAGLAVHRAGQTTDDVIKCADVALYRAKELGRNRLVCE